MMLEPSPASRPAIGVSLAVFRKGLVLVATRMKPPFVGIYSLPGGHLEAGETLEEAALRELYEEVGVTARVIAFNQHVETVSWDSALQYSKYSRHFVIASFVGEWLSGEPRPGPEAGEVRWVAPQDLKHLPTTPGLIPVVEAASRIFARESLA
ncbi:MAG: NUDIX domain-containing protein [Beijerinckiaceae bacterium]|nr:MAG: NUDIX domain-containing protein [Beijerinckiaceae bacterium]